MVGEGRVVSVCRYTKAINRSSVGQRVLKVKHPKGCVGAGTCGMLFAVNFSQELEEATLSYKVKFDTNYDWTAGGKLPGLCDAGAAPWPCLHACGRLAECRACRSL